jgi:hypothetical protein
MHIYKTIKAGTLGLGLTFSGAIDAAANQDRSAPDFRVPMPVNTPGTKPATIAIDADKLGPAPGYNYTIGFLFQLDPHAGQTVSELSEALNAGQNNRNIHPALKATMIRDLENLMELRALVDDNPYNQNPQLLSKFKAHLQTHGIQEKHISAIRLASIRIIQSRANTAPGYGPQ